MVALRGGGPGLWPEVFLALSFSSPPDRNYAREILCLNKY